MRKKVNIKIRGIQHFSLAENNTVIQDLSNLGAFDPQYLPLSEDEENTIREYLKKSIERYSVTPETVLETRGIMTLEDGRVKITYDESEITGMKGSKTALYIDESGIVTLSRSGKTRSFLVFQDGKRHICDYGKTYDSRPICINTKSLKSTVYENGAMLDIDYVVEVGGAKAEHNRFEINVTRI